MSVAALTAVVWGGALQGVAVAAPAPGAHPDTKGAGVSTKWMDASGGSAPASKTGSAHDLHEAAPAGKGHPTGRAAAVAGGVAEAVEPAVAGAQDGHVRAVDERFRRGDLLQGGVQVLCQGDVLPEP
jgi:hypothetical protein